MSENEINGAAPMLQEALGVTPEGNCTRHPHCPVLSTAHNSITPCRLCFSEEKSSGVRQRKSFAAVVQQLQRLSSGDDDDNNNHDAETANPEGKDDQDRRRVQRNHSANMQALIVQQPQTMDAVTKRMTQVQNWVLRQKEKEVLSLQLQIQRLEDRLFEAESVNQEQKQTIWALRRTIQEDMKLIKTFSMQRERELEGSEMASPRSTDGSHFPSPQSRAPNSRDSSVASTPSASPVITQTQVANVTNMNRVKSQLDRAKQRLSASNHSGVLSAYYYTDDDDEDDSERDNGDPSCRRSSYWNVNHTAKLANDPSKLFASFRGGLLDIPKSPPKARHDNNRNKLQLDTSQMKQLTVPRIRGIHRAFSEDGSVISNDGSTPLSMLAANVKSLPFSPTEPGMSPSPGESQNVTGPPPEISSNTKQPLSTLSGMGSDLLPPLEGNASCSSIKDDSSAMHSVLTSTYSIVSMTTTRNTSTKIGALIGQGREDDTDEDKTGNEEDDKTVDTTPSFFNESKTMLGEPIAEELEEEEAKKETTDAESTEKEESDKFVFTVTGASCQDKYGDSGMYSGTILVTEGLPHGKGTMNYESGRVYSGQWVTGQWHGKGKLLNANGDTYEGDFVYDARHGKGVYKWDNGDVYTGDFSLDKREGRGRFCFHNGNVYEGEFVDGVFEGFGKYTFEDGYYEGEWKDGRYHGDGELRYSSGGKYVGEFRESLANGFGMEILKDGTKRRGVWERGQPVELFEKPTG
jgi:hypothetical protein